MAEAAFRAEGSPGKSQPVLLGQYYFEKRGARPAGAPARGGEGCSGEKGVEASCGRGVPRQGLGLWEGVRAPGPMPVGVCHHRKAPVGRERSH